MTRAGRLRAERPLEELDRDERSARELDRGDRGGVPAGEQPRPQRDADTSLSG
jgi:hypothetical protein